MAEQSREILRSYFEIGDRPTEEQFSHLIDSVINKPDDGISIDANNNVGIGTAAPEEMLDVNGNVKAGQLITGSIHSPVMTTWQQIQKIQALYAESWDSFGQSVAISGNWALLGAPGANPGGVSNAGSAYLYQLENGQWVQKQHIQSPNAESGGAFGFSVAIDGNWALVGAPTEGPGGVTAAGSAYLYQLENGQWVQRQHIQSPSAEVEDLFGWSVAISGNWALVGAPGEEPGAVTAAGNAYLYQLENDQWGQTQHIQSPNAGLGDLFGQSVAISGDWALVGAPGEEPGGVTAAGSAYLYQLENGQWGQTQHIQSPNAESEGYFGWSVAISGDWALVGAPTEGPGGVTEAGSAYLYQLENGQWGQTQHIQSPNAGVEGRLGFSVAIDGDWALVGAPREDSGGVTEAGSAYLYQLENDQWMYKQKLQASDVESGDWFGRFVAISGDRTLVGASDESPGGVTEAGSAYLYRLRSGVKTTGELEVGGAVRYSGPFPGTILYGAANREGPPTGDGFRIRYDSSFFDYNGQDALLFEKTDGNHPDPDGGIAFVNTGNDGIPDLALTIRGNGDVGIGTPDPNATLSVNGTATKSGGGSWEVFSDKRLKKQIKPFKDGLRLLKKVMPVWYRYNGKTGINDTNKNVGIIAQDIQKIFPYMVTNYKARLNKSDKKDADLLSFDGSALSFVVINAIKELDERLAKLESQLAGQ